MPKPNAKKKNNRAGAKTVKLIIGTAIGFILCNAVFNTLNALSERGKLQQAQPPQTPPPFKFELRWLYTPSQSLGWVLTLMIAYFFGVLIVYKSEQKYQMKHSQDDLYGSSRWATEKELKKNLYVVKENKLDKAKKAGIPLAYKNGKFYCDCTTTHSLILGATRSGKTQTFVLPFISLLASCGREQSKQSMVINDPKGEILANTYNVLKKNNYNIVVLNLKDTTRTSRWNACKFICDEYVYAKENGTDMSRVNDFVKALCGALTYDPTAKEKIWQDSARSLMEALLLHMLDVAYANDCMDKVSIAAINQFMVEYAKKERPNPNSPQGDPVNVMNEIFNSLPEGSAAKSAYSIAGLAGSGDTRAGIDFNVANAISIFGSDDGIKSLTAANEIVFEDLVREPTAVFMLVPDDRKTRHPIASLFVNQCYQALCNYLDRADIDTLPRRVNFILDEFCSMVQIDDMDSKITVSAGRNILFHLFIQDFTFLDSKYERVSKTIQSNCGNLIYIYAKDNETNKAFSEMLGSRTVPYTAYSGNSKELISGQNYNATEVPLMRPAELSVLQMGETIVKRQRMYPIFSSFEFYYKTHKDKSKLKDVCPLTKPLDSKDAFDLSLLDTTQENTSTAAPNRPTQEQQQRLGFDEMYGAVMGKVQRQLSSQQRQPRYSSADVPSPPSRASTMNEPPQNVTIPAAMKYINRMTRNEYGDAFSQGKYNECVQFIRRAKVHQPDPLPQEYADELIRYINQFTNKNIKL